MKWKRIMESTLWKQYTDGTNWLDIPLKEFGIIIKQIKEFDYKESGDIQESGEYLIDNYMGRTYGDDYYYNFTDEEVEEVKDEIGFRCAVVFYIDDDIDCLDPEKTNSFIDQIIFIFDKNGNILDWDDCLSKLDKELIDTVGKMAFDYINERGKLT